jgi:hypothetical protein
MSVNCDQNILSEAAVMGVVVGWGGGRSDYGSKTMYWVLRISCLKKHYFASSFIWV